MTVKGAPRASNSPHYRADVICSRSAYRGDAGMLKQLSQRAPCEPAE
jgi:hypothetical protein